MENTRTVSTGMEGFDSVIDSLRLGDNVVWKVETVDDYQYMVDRYVVQALADNRRLVYVRFGNHGPVVPDSPRITTYHPDPSKGFEVFAGEVHELIKKEGRKAFYVFDCLTDLLLYWHSDVMIGNFFRVTCPYLFELDTVAYFAIRRNVHTFVTIARIRETTQLLLDLYFLDGKLYIHPLKVWERYSPTMFFPHLILEQEAVSVTASSDAAGLFSKIHRSGERQDYWDIVFSKARLALAEGPEEREAVKKDLMHLFIGSDSRMFDLCLAYFELEDILAISSRELGTGFIGGKSVGMLLARKIIEKDGTRRLSSALEMHDSYYLGADVFYSYIVQNGWWRLRAKQKTQEGYYKYAAELKEKLASGAFPKYIEEQFVQMLEYFGQSPIIVRSSSLLEDNFGNAFAGKYESVFCANQGTPEERIEAFEQAIRTVYASTMNEDALAYRMNRGLFQHDEQMAILVQRVSGDRHDDYFFPHAAGVGNSSNLYVWDKNIDMEAGMLRLVFGLGTKAVDRTDGDYAHIVCLDDPARPAPMEYEDARKYSQNKADVISLRDNQFAEVPLDSLFAGDIKAEKDLFASPDFGEASRLRELGYTNRSVPRLYDFKKMLSETRFPQMMKEMLALLSKAYDYPVDIEFTVNFTPDNRFKINLLQCRPLQTRGLGKPVALPEITDREKCLFSSAGNFMGGNVRLPIDYVIYVKPVEYLALPEREKYAVARCIGELNGILKDRNVMLLGPGRWGTTTPSLGVPVHFAEISGVSVLCEVSPAEAGFAPELSYGSHFFQDLVEAGIFYAAIFDGQRETLFNPERVLGEENRLTELFPDLQNMSGVIVVAVTSGMELFSDIISQKVICT